VGRPTDPGDLEEVELVAYSAFADDVDFFSGVAEGCGGGGGWVGVVGGGGGGDRLLVEVGGCGVGGGVYFFGGDVGESEGGEFLLDGRAGFGGVVGDEDDLFVGGAEFLEGFGYPFD